MRGMRGIAFPAGSGPMRREKRGVYGSIERPVRVVLFGLVGGVVDEDDAVPLPYPAQLEIQ